MADVFENSEHSYQVRLRHALKCCQDFMMDSSQEVITRTFAMNDLKQIELPSDFVDIVKLGIQCGDKIKVMGTSDNIALRHDVDGCGNPIAFDNCNCDVNTLPINYTQFGGYYFFNPINDYGEMLGGMFGYGGGYDRKGYYTVIRNQTPAVIQFSSEVNNTNIYIEYISTGFNPTQATVINQYAKELIVEYIHWKMFFFAGDPRWKEAKDEFYNEYNKVRHRLMDLSIRDILELSRRYQGQAPKQ